MAAALDRGGAGHVVVTRRYSAGTMPCSSRGVAVAAVSMGMPLEVRWGGGVKVSV